MSDLPTWARVLLYGAGAIATAVVLYAVIYLAVRAALRASLAEQRASARRQEDLLRTIATSAEYVADVADAWAEGEAARRAGSEGPERSDRSDGAVELSEPPPAPREPAGVPAAVVSSAPPDHDHTRTGEDSH